MTQLIGYARVSSRSQNLDSQIDLLTQAGCKKIFQDKASSIKESRPDWDRLLDYARPGDTIVITELSRMTRSLMHLLKLFKEFEDREFNIRSLRENIDTSTASGRAFVLLMGVINQLEKELKAERAAAGRESAKARGRTGGRPRTDEAKLQQAKILYENSEHTASNVCKMAGVGKRTFFRFLSQN